jgi:hypothetical protein
VKRTAFLRYAARNRKAIATPAANAANESSVMTGTGGHGAGPLPMTMAGAAGGAASAAVRTVRGGCRRAHRHHPVLEMVSHQPPVHRIGEDEADDKVGIAAAYARVGDKRAGSIPIPDCSEAFSIRFAAEKL